MYCSAVLFYTQHTSTLAGWGLAKRMKVSPTQKGSIYYYSTIYKRTIRPKEFWNRIRIITLLQFHKINALFKCSKERKVRKDMWNRGAIKNRLQLHNVLGPIVYTYTLFHIASSFHYTGSLFLAPNTSSIFRSWLGGWLATGCCCRRRCLCRRRRRRR